MLQRKLLGASRHLCPGQLKHISAVVAPHGHHDVIVTEGNTLLQSLSWLQYLPFLMMNVKHFVVGAAKVRGYGYESSNVSV